MSSNGVAKAPKHQRNDTLNVAAFKLGQLVPYGILDLAVITRDLAQAARKIGLDDGEIELTITSGLNAGRQYPRRLPFLKSNQKTSAVDPPQKSGRTPSRRSLLSLAKRIRTTRNASQIGLDRRPFIRQAGDGWYLMVNGGDPMTWPGH